MKIRNTKLSKRTLAIGAVTLVLLVGGSAGTIAAGPAIQSQNYDAEFELEHLQIHLLENGRDVCGGDRQLGDSFVGGELLQYLGSSRSGETIEPGAIEPGVVYKEEIAAKNGKDVGEYVRLSIRKYWKDPDGQKDQTMDTDLIELTYNGGEYNKGPWQKNGRESTPEMETYYYTKMLAGNATTEPVVNQLKVNGKILNKVKTQTVDNVVTYEYEYDGYRVCIEADVQSLQKNNVNDAIQSVWGVQNVSVSGTSLTVK